MAKPEPINLVEPIMAELERHLGVCEPCYLLRTCGGSGGDTATLYCISYIEAVLRGEEVTNASRP